jgi:hypothetical protein
VIPTLVYAKLSEEKLESRSPTRADEVTGYLG